MPITNEPTGSYATEHSTGHRFGSTNMADSAGQPWAGRAFESNPWSDDDGTTPEPYASALAVLRDLPAEALLERARAQKFVVDAIRECRFLIPLLAEAGDLGFTEEGLKVDKTQELAVVSVKGPNGQRVLPVFSSVAAMSVWNPEARPVPADARRVALAASSDGAQWIVIDPGSDTEFVVRRPAVEAIAKGEPWTPSPIDPSVDAGMINSIAGEFRIQNISLVVGDPDARGLSEELVVQVKLVPGLSQQELDDVVSSLSRRWAENPRLGLKIDSLRIQLISGQD